MIRIPTHRAPTHPGEILREEFLESMNITQMDLAKRLNIPFQRVNQIIGGKRSVTPDTALRLSALLDTTVDFWLNLQMAWDVYHAQHAPAAASIARIEAYHLQRELENFSNSMKRVNHHLTAKAAGGGTKKRRTG
jgi:addiction module HigA family antidote